MLSRLGAILGLSMLFGMSSAHAESYIVYPDSFRIQETDGSPLISVKEVNDEIVATLSLEVSFQSLLAQLKASYGEEFVDLDLTQVSLLPLHFDAMSEFFSAKNPAWKRQETSFDVNKAKIRFFFRKDYSLAQIREALMFPISLGTLDAKVLCLGTSQFEGCGQQVNRLPLINRFASGQSPEQALAQNDLVFLRNYAAHLILSSEAFLSEGFASSVKSQYFAQGDCNRIQRQWDRAACSITSKYSPLVSIREAVVALSQQVYPSQALTDNFAYFVFAASQLNLREINLALDFEKIRLQLNQNFGLTLYDKAKNPVPFIREARTTSQIAFTLQPSVLYWEGQELQLALGKHLTGRSNIDLLPSFGSALMSIPVTYAINFRMKYNPLTEALVVDALVIEDLEFLEKTGIGYDFAQANKAKIQDLVSGYLNTPVNKANFDAQVLKVLRDAQNAKIGFDLLR